MQNLSMTYKDSGRPADARIDGRDIYFVYPDNILAYDCVTCGGKCCKGYGAFPDAKSQVSPLLNAHPAVAPFLSIHCDTVSFQNLAPACAFIDPDDRCSLQSGQDRSVHFLSLWEQRIMQDELRRH
jgi:hypothetical protein